MENTEYKLIDQEKDIDRKIYLKRQVFELHKKQEHFWGVTEDLMPNLLSVDLYIYLSCLMTLPNPRNKEERLCFMAFKESQNGLCW